MKKVLVMMIACIVTQGLVFGVADAKKITDIKKISNSLFYHFQGKVTKIDSDKEYLIASEKMVVLVDAAYGRKTFTTYIRDVNGKQIPFEEIKKGAWIGVVGGELLGKSVAAGTIFLLPRQLFPKDMGRYPAFAAPPVWLDEMKAISGRTGSMR